MNKSVAILMCGLPGSGKSTIAEHIRVKGIPPVIHSSDALRKEIYGNAATQGDNKALFAELYRRICADLDAGKNIILDATSLTKSVRGIFLKEVAGHCDHAVCVFVYTPVDVCKERNASRDRIVPEEVIDKMKARFEKPELDEGFFCIVTPDKNHGVWKDDDIIEIEVD